MNLPPLAPAVTMPEALSINPSRFERVQSVFENPIIEAPSADPWMIQDDGVYYYIESRDQTDIYIRKASSLTNIAEDEGTLIWSAPATGANSKSVWAPELHKIGDCWYIYYAADDGLNENHRMWVLRSTGKDPLGEYTCLGSLNTETWAIDGTVLEMNDGQFYFVWSGWPGEVNGQQNIYIAPMSNPWTISGPRSLLCAPQESWECVDMAICEGPQILKRNGKIFIIYSASGSWTADYCLGMLVFNGTGNICDAASWQKVGPVLSRNEKVWGVGHCSFVSSPDGTEDWILFHVKSKHKKGWNDRRVHAQPFTWTEEGWPHFGTPIAAGTPIPLPSAALIPANY